MPLGAKTGDPHYRSAALVFGRPIGSMTKDERQVGKILNALAAYGHLDRTGLIADLCSVSLNRAAELVDLYRKHVLGIEMGTGYDGQ